MSHDVTLLVDVAQGLGEPRKFCLSFSCLECFASLYFICAYDVILQMVHSAVKRWSENFSGITIFYHTHGRNYVVVMLGVYENIFRDVFQEYGH